MIIHLQQWASERGYLVAWGPASVVAEAKAGITAMGASGELDPDFFRAELLSAVLPEESAPGKNVIMIAVPCPAHSVTFDLGEGALEAILPPTYAFYQATYEGIRQDLASNGLPGCQVEHLHGPCKTIAVRLGLVRYGKNNITYAPGIGSYLRLCGYWTDAELATPHPAPPTTTGPSLLPECADCDRCRKACPTKAIGEDRVLLRAHRCLTYANENAGEWPAWAADGPHRCLVGCLICQRVCPANPELPVEDTGLHFSVQETRALLHNCDQLPAGITSGIRKKLAWLGPAYLEAVLGRNLAALVEARQKTFK